MIVFVDFTLIREKMEADLRIDFVCSEGICGACAMTIIRVPKLDCYTFTKEYS
ncbi:succinate dehydrogenase/fumarate reductase iron-sulfur subunit, partial [Campylobacter jejuni subsp. jejuni]